MVCQREAVKEQQHNIIKRVKAKNRSEPEIYRLHNISHVTTYQTSLPQNNGNAESTVETTKRLLKELKDPYVSSSYMLHIPLVQSHLCGTPNCQEESFV